MHLGGKLLVLIIKFFAYKMKKNNHLVAKGGAWIGFIIGITAFLTGGLGLLILDAITCDFNVVFSSGCGGVSTSGGNPPAAGNACTSAPNSCGMTNTGFIVSASTDDGDFTGLVCNATVPPESSCAAPSIGVGGFYAQPSILGPGMSATLYWTATDATECGITSDAGFSSPSQPASGSISTGPVTVTSVYTLTCKNGEDGPTSSASVKVVVDPKYREI